MYTLGRIVVAPRVAQSILAPQKQTVIIPRGGGVAESTFKPLSLHSTLFRCNLYFTTELLLVEGGSVGDLRGQRSG